MVSRQLLVATSSQLGGRAGALQSADLARSLGLSRVSGRYTAKLSLPIQCLSAFEREEEVIKSDMLPIMLSSGPSLRAGKVFCPVQTNWSHSERVVS